MRGRSIDYQPPCLVSRMGSTAPPLKKLMKTTAAPMIVTYQSSKRKVVQGVTQKATTGKRLRRTRPSAAQVNDPYFPRTDVQFSDPVLSQLLSIASQSALGAEPLCQALDSTPIESLSADSQKEPISVGTTDASTTAENVGFILDACGNFLIYSILILHSISCYARYFSRKHSCKSRSLTISLLKIILLLLMSKLSIP